MEPDVPTGLGHGCRALEKPEEDIGFHSPINGAKAHALSMKPESDKSNREERGNRRREGVERIVILVKRAAAEKWVASFENWPLPS